MTENPELNKLIDAINGGEQVFSQIGGLHMRKVAHHLVKKGFKLLGNTNFSLESGLQGYELETESMRAEVCQGNFLGPFTQLNVFKK